VIMAVAWLGGLTVGRNRRWQAAASAQARKLEAELEEARIEAVHAERIQLARELHDVVSHAVGVIAMQAAAAEVSWPDSPGAALRALDAVDVTAQQALAELERVVPGAEPATPGTADDLTALVARIRATGTQVTLTSDGALEAAAAAVAYRIVQESLTNAVRHAPGAAVSVRVLADRDGTHVDVADDGPWPGPGHPRGYGLVGLTERVTLAGGTVTTGPGPGGAGFVVAAHLPRIRARSA
jgi:signal transduction histidine kinase